MPPDEIQTFTEKKKKQFHAITKESKLGGLVLNDSIYGFLGEVEKKIMIYLVNTVMETYSKHYGLIFFGYF